MRHGRPDVSSAGVFAARTSHRLAAALGLLLLVACAHDYGLENRDIPVHVWMSAPEVSARGGSLAALVYVGSEKVVEGPVAFPRGVGYVELPTVYLRHGDVTVSAVLQGGAMNGTEEVTVEGESWILIQAASRGVEISLSRRQPSP
jgi:hypothetical protein